MSRITLNKIMVGIIDVIVIIILCAMKIPELISVTAGVGALIGIVIAIVAVRYMFVRYIGFIVKLICCGLWSCLVIFLLYKDLNFPEDIQNDNKYIYIFIGVFAFAFLIHIADLFIGSNKRYGYDNGRDSWYSPRYRAKDDEFYDEDEYEEYYEEDYENEYTDEYDDGYDEYYDDRYYDDENDYIENDYIKDGYMESEDEYYDEYLYEENYEENYEDEYYDEYSYDEPENKYDDEDIDEERYYRYYNSRENKKNKSKTKEQKKRKQRENENLQEDIYVEGDVVSRLFLGCNNKESLISRYRSLMKTFHPDTGSGDVEMSQAIQVKYKELLEKYK